MENEENLVTEELLDEAQIAFKTHFKPETKFERAIFLSWFCSKADCDFCYMSTIKRHIKSPSAARRSLTSILAESYLCKQLDWDIVVTGGYGVYRFSEFADIIKDISNVYEGKIAVNMGPLSRSELDLIKPYTYSIVGSIETTNKDLHKRVAPSKPVEPFLRMYGEAHDFEKGINIILGLGESLSDIQEFHRFIETHGINRATFYPLIPEKETRYTKGPSSFYVARWIAETRLRFPGIKIVAGTWTDRVAEIGLFLRAGANNITKFPAIKMFNSEQAKIIEEECKNAGRKFIGTLTDTNYLKNIDKLDIDDDIKSKINKYVSLIKKSK